MATARASSSSEGAPSGSRKYCASSMRASVKRRFGRAMNIQRVVISTSQYPAMIPIPTYWAADTAVRPSPIGAGRVKVGEVLAMTLATLALAAPQPAIVQRPIPFPARRRREPARYAHRHHGSGDYHLRAPKVIVEHYTVTSSFQSTWNTFAPDRADPE